MLPADHPTAESAGSALDRLPPDVEARVVDIPQHLRSELAGEGLRVGTTVRVTGRAPFGGPILLVVGRARLAVARSVAAGILVESVGVEAAPPSASSAQPSGAGAATASLVEPARAER